MKIEFTPIGIIHTPFETPENMPIQPASGKNIEGWIEIFEEYTEGLSDLEGFSHIYLLFHLHKSRNFKLKVIPFLDTVERGIFSTRSPARPNPLGLSVVEILSIKKNIIRIKGIDMLNGTPLIDIKPFVPDFEQYENIRKGWFEGKLKNISGKLSDDRFKE
jgi:tRNA (adenine37-N6)-methyltransferase